MSFLNLNLMVGLRTVFTSLNPNLITGTTWMLHFHINLSFRKIFGIQLLPSTTSPSLHPTYHFRCCMDQHTSSQAHTGEKILLVVQNSSPHSPSTIDGNQVTFPQYSTIVIYSNLLLIFIPFPTSQKIFFNKNISCKYFLHLHMLLVNCKKYTFDKISFLRFFYSCCWMAVKKVAGWILNYFKALSDPEMWDTTTVWSYSLPLSSSRKSIHLPLHPHLVPPALHLILHKWMRNSAWDLESAFVLKL